jgi:hypothetical protein
MRKRQLSLVVRYYRWVLFNISRVTFFRGSKFMCHNGWFFSSCIDGLHVLHITFQTCAIPTVAFVFHTCFPHQLHHHLALNITFQTLCLFLCHRGQARRTQDRGLENSIHLSRLHLLVHTSRLATLSPACYFRGKRLRGNGACPPPPPLHPTFPPLPLAGPTIALLLWSHLASKGCVGG